MIGDIDYVGVGALVSSITAGIVAIIVALRQTSTHAQIADVQHSVTTSNGQTIGELVESNEIRRVEAAEHPEGTP